MSKIFRQCMPYGIRKTAEGAWEAFNRDYQPLGVLTPKSWTVKHEAYRSDSDIQLESDLLISG